MKANLLELTHGLATTLLCWILLSTSALAQTLVLHSEPGEPLSNPEQTGFLDRIAAEAFRRNGLQLKLVDLPAQRGLANANAGIEDGELIRIAGMENLYPNLRRVPEKIFVSHFVAFTRDDSITIDGWESLARYSIGYVRGWKIYEFSVPESATTTLVKNGEDLFALLARDRIDVALYSQYLGLEIIRRQQIEDARVVHPPLASREMFMYLHKKHEDRIDGISAALKAIKAEGIYDLEISDLRARYPGARWFVE